MLLKKKPFPGDAPDQKVNFGKPPVKPLPKKPVVDLENAADAKKPGDKKEDAKDKKKPVVKGKKGNKGAFWAKKAAMAVAKGQ